jgi:predicted DNA-binding transcriptional regulator AlpA
VNAAAGDQEDRRARLTAVPEGGLITAKQVAHLLAMSEAWVWKKVRENAGFPFVRISGRCVRFDPKKVRAWIDARSQGAVQ